MCIRDRYEVENFKDTPVTLDIVEQINALARQYGADPRGDAEWELGAATSAAVAVSTTAGASVPTLSVELPARPDDPDEPVAKQTFIFHLTLKNLW